MQLGEVIGTVVASRKDRRLHGIRLLIVQPLDHARNAVGSPVVAVDTVSAGTGELIYWVGSREAPNALPDKDAPVDAAIVGIADRIDL